MKQIVVGIRCDWTPGQGHRDDGMRAKPINGQVVVDFEIGIECVYNSKWIDAIYLDSHWCFPNHGTFAVISPRPGESYFIPLALSIWSNAIETKWKPSVTRYSSIWLLLSNYLELSGMLTKHTFACPTASSWRLHLDHVKVISFTSGVVISQKVAIPSGLLSETKEEKNGLLNNRIHVNLSMYICQLCRISARLICR